MDNKTSLYSRQIGAIGSDTMGKLSNLKAYILDLDTIGLETAKCLCLLGIKKLYINDKRKITNTIKGNNYGISDSDAYNLVDESVINYLKQLNRYVDIEVSTLSECVYEDIDVLIQTKLNNSSKYNAIKLNERCRIYNVKYILGINIGLTGYIFNDFGPEHIITDFDGEKYKSGYIENITHTDTQTVLEISDGPIEFYEGLKFKFVEPKVDKIFNIEKIVKNKIYIDKITDDLPESSNIFIYEVKSPTNISHKKLNQVIKKAEYPDSVINIPDYDRCISIISDIYSLILEPNKVGGVYDTSVVINTKNEFPIIGSILGSIIAQETVKITGKYTPLNQELILDYSELYREKDLYKSCANKKYSNVYSLLSKDHIKYLQKMNIFLVGCGALGCEYLKLFSLLNISTTKNAKLTVTDMDHIELSNLNRQFLFREDDIGKSKSQTAVDKILKFNKNMKIKSYDKAVGIENEIVFNRSFWDSQDIIVNALDNVEAREYVDSKCILHRKPLFESGTLGTKCNIQIVLPYKTKSYSETRDPPELAIPMCTVKNFPFKIEHCIEWSMEVFNKYFNELVEDVKELHKGPLNFMNYIKTIDNDSILHDKLKTLDYMSKSLENLSSKNLAQFSRIMFDDLFVNPIKQLIHSFPLDRLCDDGSKFWSGNKLSPKIIDTETCSKFPDFIENFTKLLCKCFGLKYDIENINDTEYDLLKEFKVSDNFNIKVKDSDKIKEGHIDLDLAQQNTALLDRLCSLNIDNNFKFNKEDFEKDDDDNGHVDTITSISNIRAEVYSIDQTTNLDCKLIAGKVIPALSTTTTLVTALAVMEMLKYTYNIITKKDNLINMDHFINSSINTYLQAEPQEADTIIDGQFNNLFGSKIKAVPQKFSNWDVIKLDRRVMGIVELSDLLSFIKNKYNIDIDMLCCENKIVYNKYNSINVNKKFSEIYEELSLPKTEYLILNISTIDKSGIPILTPKLVYCWDI